MTENTIRKSATTRKHLMEIGDLGLFIADIGARMLVCGGWLVVGLWCTLEALEALRL